MLANASWLGSREGEGIWPVYCGERVGEDALNYAEQRDGDASKEIKVLDAK